jgi:hypothetical protein
MLDSITREDFHIVASTKWNRNDYFSFTTTQRRNYSGLDSQDFSCLGNFFINFTKCRGTRMCHGRTVERMSRGKKAFLVYFL